MATKIPRESDHFHVLSVLSLTPSQAASVVPYIASLDHQGRTDLFSMADSHHVVVRAFRALQPVAAGHPELETWISATLNSEQDRIQNALKHLDNVCRELESAGCPVTVIKSLDHWPDLGNDLDLYSTANERDIVHAFTQKLGARIEPRSWGDRLAYKWNFALPGLRESIEVHSRRLGQTGEHLALARRFVDRRVPKQINGYTFFIPAPEERIIAATLQRMYRHFYFRLCDIVNSAALVESGTLNHVELNRAADLGSIWPGVATYLVIVSDYVRKYRGAALDLPQQVVKASQFGGDKLYVQRRFLRIPVMPEAARLFTSQVTGAALRGDVPATFRLSLLPPLASVAALAFKITGNDKRIW